MISLSLAVAIVMPIQSSAVEVPFHVGDDAIIVDALVNGKKASFMFDTGFSGSILLDDTFNVGAPTGSMTLRDFVGEFQAKTVKLNSLKVGAMDVTPKDSEIVQQPVGHMSLGYNAHCDGILGFEPMSKHVFEINFQKKKFIFHPKSVDISKRVPDNSKTFLTRLLPLGHNAIDMEVMTPEGKRMVMALDTGNAFFATTHKDVLERVGLWESGRKPTFMHQSWIGSGPTNSFYVQMPKLTIFGVPTEASVWSIIEASAASANHDGTIGFGFLKNFNTIIDMDRRRVWFERITDKVENEAPADVGISATFDPEQKRVRIFAVTPGGPAEKAGIKRGDAILGIDETEMHDIGYRRLQALLQGPAGTVVKLAISSGGNLTRYELKREVLINHAKK